jgi:hypothetical protein
MVCVSVAAGDAIAAPVSGFKYPVPAASPLLQSPSPSLALYSENQRRPSMARATVTMLAAALAVLLLASSSACVDMAGLPDPAEEKGSIFPHRHRHRHVRTPTYLLVYLVHLLP